MKVVIIGAGVAGLGIGWRRRQAGCSVTILERAQPGGGASWAAAGMLAVTAELEDSAEPERALALRASALWPAFA
ncbi:MAG: FAD-dependent oxidoreductase, partial [Alphaproteobacteria bacterium]